MQLQKICTPGASKLSVSSPLDGLGSGISSMPAHRDGDVRGGDAPATGGGSPMPKSCAVKTAIFYFYLVRVSHRPRRSTDESWKDRPANNKDGSFQTVRDTEQKFKAKVAHAVITRDVSALQ